MEKKTNSLDCDPACCDNCYYIGEGDSYCDVYEELVLADWNPTEYYHRCMFQPEREKFDDLL